MFAVGFVAQSKPRPSLQPRILHNTLRRGIFYKKVLEDRISEDLDDDPPPTQSCLFDVPYSSPTPVSTPTLAIPPTLTMSPILMFLLALKAGIFMYMAEMRPVTTLFVKLDSYSPEKHKNLLSLQVGSFH